MGNPMSECSYLRQCNSRNACARSGKLWMILTDLLRCWSFFAFLYAHPQRPDRSSRTLLPRQKSYIQSSCIMSQSVFESRQPNMASAAPKEA
jgi:hypothetical protein